MKGIAVNRFFMTIEKLQGRILEKYPELDGERIWITRELVKNIVEEIKIANSARERVEDSPERTSSISSQLPQFLDGFITEQMINSTNLLGELYPTTFDTLGLEEVISGLCRHFERGYGNKIIFTGIDIPRISFSERRCLYRFVQAALAIVGVRALWIQVFGINLADQTLLVVEGHFDKRNEADPEAANAISYWLEMFGGHLQVRYPHEKNIQLIAQLPIKD